MIKPLSYINLCICLSSFKLLFLKSYVSTDFDVHRNWMAITHNLPIRQWYFDKTSQWTLDYPPLFAWLEFILAYIAHLLNLNDALELTESSIRIESIIVYQKITVIISDFLYYYGAYKLSKSLEPFVSRECTNGSKLLDQNILDAIYRPNATSCVALLLLLQPGLLLVDHIHFQYNGFLSGIFLLSMASIISCHYGQGSFWFAILLNFKHIYLYCVPSFGMYLLSSFCLLRKKQGNNQYRIATFLRRIFKLGSIVVMVFLVTYLPFFEPAILKQILNRLFPFKRGLTHAYWAPNIWSIYNTADKILTAVFGSRLKATFDLESISIPYHKRISSTSGLVQEYEHQFLPSVQPLATFILVAAFTVPLVIKFLINYGRISPRLFIKGVTLAALTSFMFGWHVHEKAIVLVLLPMIPTTFIQHSNPNLRKTFLRLTLAGTYSLFPLLFQPAEYFTKLTIMLAYYFYARSLCGTLKYNNHNHGLESKGSKLYNLLDKSFMPFIILIEIYVTLIHGRFNHNLNPLAKLNKYEFLPLMLTSSFSALSITISYMELYYDFALDDVGTDAAT